MNFLFNGLGKLSPILLFSIGTITIVLGDVFAKYWSQSPKNTTAVLSLLFYILGAFIFIAIVSKTHSVGISNVIWNIAGIVGTLLAGYFLFNEVISITQFIGIGFGIIAIIFLTL